MDRPRERKMILRNRRGIDKSMNQFISKMKDIIGDTEQESKARNRDFGGKMIMRSSRRQRKDPKGSRHVEYYQPGYQGNSISGKDIRKSRRSRDVVSTDNQIVDKRMIQKFERSLEKKELRIQGMTDELEELRRRQKKILENSEKNTILSDLDSVQERSSQRGLRQKAAKLQQEINEVPNFSGDNTFMSEQMLSKDPGYLEVSSSQVVGGGDKQSRELEVGRLTRERVYDQEEPVRDFYKEKRMDRREIQSSKGYMGSRETEKHRYRSFKKSKVRNKEPTPLFFESEQAPVDLYESGDRLSNNLSNEHSGKKYKNPFHANSLLKSSQVMMREDKYSDPDHPKQRSNPRTQKSEKSFNSRGSARNQTSNPQSRRSEKNRFTGEMPPRRRRSGVFSTKINPPEKIHPTRYSERNLVFEDEGTKLENEFIKFKQFYDKHHSGVEKKDISFEEHKTISHRSNYDMMGKEDIRDFQKNVNVIEVQSENETQEGQTEMKVDQNLLSQAPSKPSNKLQNFNQMNNLNPLLSQQIGPGHPHLLSQQIGSNHQTNFKKKSAECIAEEYDFESGHPSTNRSSRSPSPEHEFELDLFEERKFVNSDGLNSENFETDGLPDIGRQTDILLESSHHMEHSQPVMIETGGRTGGLSHNVDDYHDSKMNTNAQEIHPYQVQTLGTN